MQYLSETCPEKKDPRRTPRRKTVEVKGCFHWSLHTRSNCRCHTTTDLNTLLNTFPLFLHISFLSGLVESLSFCGINVRHSVLRTRRSGLSTSGSSRASFDLALMTCLHFTLRNLVCESVGTAVITHLWCLSVGGGRMS